MDELQAMADVFNISAKELRETAIDQFGHDFTVEDLELVAEELSA